MTSATTQRHRSVPQALADRQRLGVNLDTLYTVEMVTTHEGRPIVVLRHGRGNHLALMKIPPGHLAVVQRADQIPNEIVNMCDQAPASKRSPRTKTVVAIVLHQICARWTTGGGSPRPTYATLRVLES